MGDVYIIQCVIPVTIDEIINGKTSIFNIRIKISPGKLMSIIVSGLKFNGRRKKPSIEPITTPRNVIKRRAFPCNFLFNF